MKLLFSFLFILLATQVYSQHRPQNGIVKSSSKKVLLINANIYASADSYIENGSILIENDRIVKVGKKVKAPSGTRVIDVRGRFILPSFIELHSNAGLKIEEPSKKQNNFRPQIESLKQNSFYWNEAVHPELNASEFYISDPEKMRELNHLGFGFCLSHIKDGIVRGTGVLISADGKELSKDIVDAKAASFFSFSKGSSKQSYPSSQMGSIALLRQSFYDLKYYSESAPSFTDLSMDSWHQQEGLPKFFKTEDKWEILRASKISKEFGLEFIYFGSGNEYEAANALKEHHVRIVLPLNFPDAYDVSDPYLSRLIPLSQLKHWELATMNYKELLQKEIQIALTSEGVKDSKQFWKNIRRLMSTGVSRLDILNSLTAIPASFLGKSDIMGTIAPGKYASFSIYDKDPFKKESSQINSVCLKGEMVELNPFNSISLAGSYDLNIDGLRRRLVLTGPDAKPKCLSYYLDNEFKLIDSTKSKADFKISGNDITIKFLENNETEAIVLHGKISNNGSIIEGDAILPDGDWRKWSAIAVSKKANDVKKPVIDTSWVGSCWSPNMAYGLDSSLVSNKTVFRNATVWTNEADGILTGADVLVENGKIVEIIKDSPLLLSDALHLRGANIIDATGLHLTSGIIDEHSHIAISKGVNESGQAVSAEVSISDVVNPDDINIYRQLSGGVTCSQLLHGSANPIGGQSAIVKLKWGAQPDEMLIDGADGFIKFALGENVKQSNWGNFNTVRFPQTRMGVEQVFYDGFHRARLYKKEWEAFKKKERGKSTWAPRIDLELETLCEILDSKRFITCHSYVQSEINMLMHVADSMGFRVNTFTHILEGYKLADKMKKHGVGGSTFSDWWAYKYEVNDAIPYNASLMTEAGVVVAINSDDAEMGRRLNQEAAKSVKYGGMSQETAWKMVTLNPAKLLHLDNRMGSIKEGKDADLVLWSANPLSIMAKVQKTMIEGKIYYDRERNLDFELRNTLERARIIQKMALDNTAGRPMRTFKPEKEKFFHCDSRGEVGETKTNLH